MRYVYEIRASINQINNYFLFHFPCRARKFDFCRKFRGERRSSEGMNVKSSVLRYLLLAWMVAASPEKKAAWEKNGNEITRNGESRVNNRHIFSIKCCSIWRSRNVGGFFVFFFLFCLCTRNKLDSFDPMTGRGSSFKHLKAIMFICAPFASSLLLPWARRRSPSLPTEWNGAKSAERTAKKTKARKICSWTSSQLSTYFYILWSSFFVVSFDMSFPSSHQSFCPLAHFVFVLSEFVPTSLRDRNRIRDARLQRFLSSSTDKDVRTNRTNGIESNHRLIPCRTKIECGSGANDCHPTTFRCFQRQC